ncbi:MAG: LLM class flavin-dependent oxidoreductase [Dehalococcoidia bacterium]|nr:LLM class flavin-dependent oxidoreductase [Dehalococcoidia bacterium]
MQYGLYLRSFLTDRARPLHEQFDDLVEICHVARDAGFSTVTMPQHWISHPTVWPQPFQTLARLVPETGEMNLLTGIVLLPLYNPVLAAEEVATLDQLSKGRVIFGVGIGYREAELAVVGATRKERASRLTESIEAMKQLWQGEAVNHAGEHWRLDGARMGFTPVQKPHPPIWIACQSDGAVRRAARIADACYLAPQIGFADVPALAAAYRDERAARALSPGRLTISRGVAFADDKRSAVEQAAEAAESSYRMYRTWDMQEDTMVRINIGEESRVEDWAVTGNAQDCLEGFGALAEHGVDFVNVTFYNLPKGLEARKDYLTRFAEGVINAPGQGSG